MNASEHEQALAYGALRYRLHQLFQATDPLTDDELVAGVERAITDSVSSHLFLALVDPTSPGAEPSGERGEGR